jgi:hypothetical protein
MLQIIELTKLTQTMTSMVNRVPYVSQIEGTKEKIVYLQSLYDEFNDRVDPLNFIQELYSNYTNPSLSKDTKAKYFEVKVNPFLSDLGSLYVELDEKIDILDKEVQVHYLAFMDILKYIISITELNKYELLNYFESGNLASMGNDSQYQDLKEKMQQSKGGKNFDHASSKERFVYLKEIGVFDGKKFFEHTQQKRDFATSKILGCTEDYAKKLLQYNSASYSNDSKYGIPKETINKVLESLR